MMTVSISYVHKFASVYICLFHLYCVLIRLNPFCLELTPDEGFV